MSISAIHGTLRTELLNANYVQNRVFENFEKFNKFNKFEKFDKFVGWLVGKQTFFCTMILKAN